MRTPHVHPLPPRHAAATPHRCGHPHVGTCGGCQRQAKAKAAANLAAATAAGAAWQRHQTAQAYGNAAAAALRYLANRTP